MEYSTTFGNKGVDALLKPRPQLKAMLKAVEDLVPVKSVLRDDWKNAVTGRRRTHFEPNWPPA